MKKNLIWFVLLSGQAFAQQDSVVLNEVVLTDPFLMNHYKSQSQIIVTDSILRKSSPNLSQVLQFESPVYIKENGLGMVSSPSFRGTTASQTAVIWNGININSTINGQIDFSTINAKSYDGIFIKPGGGSIAYGTGAIGGSVHLLDQLKYNQQQNHKLDLGYGSYDSYFLNYGYHYATSNISTTISYARFQSDNDYKIGNYLKENRNGKYYFNTVDANFGYRSKAHELRLFSQLNFGKREFSLTDLYETPTLYDNQDYRVMGQWKYQNKLWNSDLKVAYIHEANRYYPNKHANKTQDLEVNNWVAKYYLSYQFNPQQSVSFFTENIFSNGNGTNLSSSDRNTFGLGLLYKHQVFDQLSYEASIRQDFSSVYDVPFIYALGLHYKPLDYYTLRFNFSKNYRIPTFNDLFWETGGNPELKAENALQFELGNDFRFGGFDVQTNLYCNDIKDMIQWIPANGSSIWRPVNVNHVKTYGAEIIGNYRWNQFLFSSIYSYTKSINQATDKTLIYVPKHQFHLNVNYTYKKWNIYLQNRWVDQVYIQTDNAAIIPSYWTSNLGVGYTILDGFDARFTVNNLFDQPYQSIANRWMPGINYQFSLHINL